MIDTAVDNLMQHYHRLLLLQAIMAYLRVSGYKLSYVLYVMSRASLYHGQYYVNVYNTLCI